MTSTDGVTAKLRSALSQGYGNTIYSWEPFLKNAFSFFSEAGALGRGHCVEL